MKVADAIRGLKPEFRNHAVALALLLVLTLAMFADVLFTTQSVVLSSGGTDTFHYFVHWREFGFQQLRQGNLALWNPHYCSGMPFFGGFQSALLYPPNFLFLVLPLAKAINVGIALHVFLAGAFTYLWASGRGLHSLACFLSAVMFMFGGTYFSHIFAGHLPNLCTMVWVPLLFLAIDRLFSKPSLGPCLLGTFAVAMQILAGHLQYVFYTAVAAALYCAFCFTKLGASKQNVLGLGGICLGGAALSAVQLLTGLAESRETVRSIGVSYDFAAMFSFPPENVLTLLAPTVFGNMRNLPYWGRCYLWEMSLFVSVTGLALAIYGASAGDRVTRRFSLSMVLILFVLALGAHTPLFQLLYHYMPGFDKFRGNSKFVFLASLFLALLAGIGLDTILKKRPAATGREHGGRGSLPLIIVPLVTGILLGVVALWSRQSASNTQPDGAWHKILMAVFATKESYLPGQVYADAGFQLQAGRHTAWSLLISAGTCLFLSLLLFLARRSPKLVPGLVALAVVELFVFARSSLATFDLAAADTPGLKPYLTQRPGDYRILNQSNPNVAMSLPAEDIWGDDPGMLRRYAQFLAFTQGQTPDAVSQNIPLIRDHRLFEMLRCRFIFFHGREGKMSVMERKDVMPQLQFIGRYRVIQRRDDILAALNDPSFDLRQESILETEPQPRPIASNATGIVKLTDSSTDHLTIEADLSSPALLLITDAYSKGWRARALPGSSQREYQLLPANYCLRSIPLGSGHHFLRVEYLPPGFVVGKWVSLLSVIIFLGLLGWWGHKYFDRSRRLST